MEQIQLRVVFGTYHISAVDEPALDCGNMNQAIAECQKILRKKPNHLSAQALMSFAMARAGRIDEAERISRSVLNTAGSLKSPYVVEGLSLAFRTLGLLDEEIAVYTGALEFQPNDIKLNTKLFMVASRNSMYKEQHQAAVGLSKITKQDKHMWWVIASLMLQAKYSKLDPASQRLQMTLAERMSEKALVDGKLKTVEELRIYLDVLEMQDKHSAMADVLFTDGALSEKITNDPDLVTQRIGLLVKSHEYDKAIEAAIGTLDVRENWLGYKHYIAATVAKLGLAIKDLNAKPDSSELVPEALPIVEVTCATLNRWAQIRGRARGAKLALVELAAALGAAGHSDIARMTLSGLGDQIWEYVDQFQAKAICYKDIMPYFVVAIVEPASKRINQEVLDFHRNQLDRRIDIACESAAQSEDLAQSWVNLEKIRYLLQALSDDVNPESWVLGVDRLLQYGLDSSQAQMKQASCSDIVLIAGQRLIQASFIGFSETSQHPQLHAGLFSALCVLEAGIKQNDGSFLLKLYAIRIYLFLSCYERARAIYDSLNIKNIQFDTLGFLINGHGTSLGCYVQDLELCYEGVGFYDSSGGRISRGLESSYNNETYSNITDFIEFRDNLKNSLQRKCTHRCALRGEAFEPGSQAEIVAKWVEANADAIGHTDEAQEEALHDNRDVNVMSLLTPVDMPKWNLEILTRPAPLPGTAWIAVYSIIPQIMHHIATANVEDVEALSKKLLIVAEDAGDSLSRQDHLLVRGVRQVAALYARAVDGSQSFDEQLSDLVGTVTEALTAETPDADSPETLSEMASTTIRNATVATEIYIYACSVRYILNKQKSPSTKAVTLAISQLRKSSLAKISALRSLMNNHMRASIDKNWVTSTAMFAVPAKFMQNKRRAIVDSVAKSCFSGWSRSVKNLVQLWEQWS
ncbi:mitochondrial distribution and morphology [Coemansia erecta]|uniref:Mitochondrial distribution and morphology n=1 Tax=Coemansia erecta TaxID=147472 RepID=A0A9W7XXZ2_9FUNG|nr:mitochondrial distribution and morphology [Coemansia erecta]